MPASRKASQIQPRVLRAFRRDLLAWFEMHKRDLPWRKRKSPYRIWISELMLQQTRADQAVPYFNRFMKACPSLRALAEMPRDRVLKLWEGLGYYSRARRAHETARYLVQERGGRFPKSYEDLRALPGVGPYTAAAVSSFAWNLDEAVVDGNVIRVLARAFAYPHDVSTAKGKHDMQQLADTLLPHGRSAAFNEGIMELGALVCTPRQPRCDNCPLGNICEARRMNRVLDFPCKKKKKLIPHKRVGAAIIVNRKGQILIAQRKEDAMLAGLWEFPGGTRERGEDMRECIVREIREELGMDIKVGPKLIAVKHTFSHFKMTLEAHWACIRKGRPRNIDCADHNWVTLSEIRRYAFPKADIKVLDAIEEALSGGLTFKEVIAKCRGGRMSP